MGSLLKVFLWGYLVSGLISCEESGSGNSSQEFHKFKITLAPPMTLVNRDAYKVEGTCSNKDESITVSVGALSPVDITCDQNYRWEAAIDASGINVGESISIRVTGLDESIELTVVLDIIPPQVTITPGSIINSINQKNYRIEGTCDEVDGEVVLDVGGVEAKGICDGEGHVAERIDLSGLDTAVAQVSVTADLKDKWGNPAQRATGSLTRDITPPGSVTIATPAIINGNSINSYSLSGGCAEDGTGVVTIKIAGLNDLTVDCTDQLWNLDVPSSELAKLPEQEGIVVVIEHRDSAENVVSISPSLDKDITAPELAISSGLVINIAGQGSYRLTGECSENGRNVSIVLGSNAANAESCNNGHWTHSPSVEEGRFFRYHHPKRCRREYENSHFPHSSGERYYRSHV